ncbi:MAG: acyl-ACP--UDP-N-acetylglucosamine O-acyltransferase [Bdellovibrionales bacterium]
MGIHETAFVDSRAKIGKDVFIGPGAVVLGNTVIGDGCYLHNHATVGSNECTTVFGKNNVVFPGAVVGGIPQDLKYANEDTKLIVGDNNIFRECVTVNTGTVTGGGLTQIGDDNLIMAYCHIAHDCILGNHIVVANSSNFAGHVIVEDHVKIGGVCSFNQFVNIGAYSYIAGESSVNKDIIPYTIARGNYAVSTVTNKIGLERAGFGKEEIAGVHRAIRSVLKGSETIEKSIETILEQVEGAPNALVDHLITFIKKSERGVAR